MCVSPGTMAQFTFYRRGSDDEGRRPHLRSITEDDVVHEVEDVLDHMDLGDEADGIPVRALAGQSKSDLLDVRDAGRALSHLSQVQDMREAEHELRPLLLWKKRRRIPRPVSQSASKTLRSLSAAPVERKEWFVPVSSFMREYIKSQTYKFDFPDPPVRFALNAKAKGVNRGSRATLLLVVSLSPPLLF